jgi:hypothetical protein
MTHNTRVSEYTAWVNRHATPLGWCAWVCEHLVRCGRMDGHLWTTFTRTHRLPSFAPSTTLHAHTYTLTHYPLLPHTIYRHMSTPDVTCGGEAAKRGEKKECLLQTCAPQGGTGHCAPGASQVCPCRAPGNCEFVVSAYTRLPPFTIHTASSVRDVFGCASRLPNPHGDPRSCRRFVGWAHDDK